MCVRDLHGGDVLSREGIGSVADEQACFSHSPGIRDGQRKHHEDASRFDHI